MQRVGEQLLCRGLLHDVAQVHHGDVVREVVDHGQVVGDEDVGQTHLLLKLFQQVQDLRLDGDVQGGDWLVTDDKLGLHGQSPGDADALAAASVQLMGVGVEQPGGQPHGLHQLRHPGVDFGLLDEDMIGLDGLADDLAHRLPGVQRGVGVLKNELHVLTHTAHLAQTQLPDVLALEEYLPGGGFDEPEDSAPGGGLSAARLPHQAQGLAPLKGEGHIVHGVEHPPLGLEVFDQMPDLKDVFRHYDLSFRSMWKPGLS